MNEKDMVLDVLSNTKASLGNYATVISECNDSALRNTFKQMRNGDETFQYDLYQAAAEKGYYPAPAKADNSKLSEAKNKLTSSQTEAQGAGPKPSM